MAERLARNAYAWLLRLATPLYLARLWWRGRREPAYRQFWGERLGRTAGTVTRGRLWLHAVSLGETRAAAALVDALREQRPGLRLLLTHGTATGREAGAALLREGDAQVWLPYDTPGAVMRFLRQHRPLAGVVMETEVWPNLLYAAQAASVPMVLVNARLSARSQAKGQRLAVLMHAAMSRFAQVLAQTDDDARRLQASGARFVRRVGNLKFDMHPRPELLLRGRTWRSALGRAVVLAASTREGEEELLLRAWSALPLPRPLLLLVPRHPQRFDEVAAMVVASGLFGLRRSGWRELPPLEAHAADIWLGDSVGEMAQYYACADAALLGGSFAPLGGQNLIEAAACGCPVLMGPHTFNFDEAAELARAAGAALRVRDLPHGVQLAVDLVYAEERARMAERALAFAAQHRGAAERMARSIVALLPAAGGPAEPVSQVKRPLRPGTARRNIRGRAAG